MMTEAAPARLVQIARDHGHRAWLTADGRGAVVEILDSSGAVACHDTAYTIRELRIVLGY